MLAKNSSLTRRAALVTLTLVYAVVLAGSVVRSTGAGMGCPDWPKCFGHYIPPTEISELQFQQGHRFKAGYFIIWQDALWKAKRDLVAGPAIDPNDWEKYTKHDYAIFNAAHTWTEYVNRLMGALLGISALALVIISFRHWRNDRMVPLASLAALILIGFEAWLGALVVESKLAPVKITTHMVTALIIVAVVLWIVRRLSAATTGGVPAFSPATKRLLWVCLGLTLVQTILGTQVREEVDMVSALMGDLNRGAWADHLGAFFKVHRSFAILLLIANGLLFRRLRREHGDTPPLRRKGMRLAGVILLAAITGITLARLGMPAAAQPAHLFLAMLLFGVQLDLLLLGSSRRPLPAVTDPEVPGSVSRVPMAQV